MVGTWKDWRKKQTITSTLWLPAVQKKQAEKNADCTIKSTQQKESDLKPRNSDIPRSEFQTSSRSKLWKVNKIINLQNQICVLKLYSVWFLLCHICHVYLSFIICLFLVWVYAWNIEDNVWFKCGGVTIVLHEIRRNLSPITSSVVPCCFKYFF